MDNNNGKNILKPGDMFNRINVGNQMVEKWQYDRLKAIYNASLSAQESETGDISKP